MDSADANEQEQSGRQALRIEYGIVSGLWFLREDLQWPSAGQWQIEFIPTYKARSGFINCAYTSKALYRWRFSAADQSRALEMFRLRALDCGMERVVIVNVSQVEAVRLSEIILEK